MDGTGKSLGRPTLYALIVVGVYLTYLILRPFLPALTWAVMFAILFHGMQAAVARRVGPTRAAVVTTLFVAIVIVAPGVLLITNLAHEAPQVGDYLKETSEHVPPRMQQIWDAVRARSPVSMPANLKDVIANGTQRAVAFLGPRAGAFVAGSLATLGSLAAMLFALFFMLRDADTMRVTVRERLPFSELENERLMSGTRDLVTASVGATVIVAAVQGAIGGLAFWLLKVGPPVFWGIVIAFCSLLPIVGATIVWVPTAIALLLSGEIMRGVLMLLVGVFGITLLGNVLRPVLLSGKTSMSGLVVFFGLLGGAAAFGLVGLVIGPIVLVLTSELFDNLRRPVRQADYSVKEERTLATRVS
jgi:predicted PurR-regulated permease PerM